MLRENHVTVARLDPEPAGWLRALADTGPQREAALARLHELLIRFARVEVARRGLRLQMAGLELDDLACRAASDGLLAITGKVAQFHRESRPNDAAVIPAWTWHQLTTRNHELAVFRMTDRPIQDAFGLHRA